MKSTQPPPPSLRVHGIQGDPVTKDIEEKNKSRACFFFLIASPHPQIKLLSKGERGFFLLPAALPNAFRFLPPRIFHVGSRGWRARHSGATAGGPLFGEAPTRVGFAAPREAAAAFLRGAPGPESGARRGPRGVGLAARQALGRSSWFGIARAHHKAVPSVRSSLGLGAWPSARPDAASLPRALGRLLLDRAQTHPPVRDPDTTPGTFLLMLTVATQILEAEGESQYSTTY